MSGAGVQFIFITHPEVVIEPDIPVPQWRLSDIGRRRMEALSSALAGTGAAAVWSSLERKARDGAEILAQALSLPHHHLADLGENDRSSTGYIPQPEFGRIAEQFFANPTESVLGWETALAAQSRIVSAIMTIATEADGALQLVVSHGGVGRLLRAHLEGVSIGLETRPLHPGGGSCMAFQGPPFQPVSPWLDIEQWVEQPPL